MKGIFNKMVNLFLQKSLRPEDSGLIYSKWEGRQRGVCGGGEREAFSDT
jgi:hypothetical protein